MTTDQHLTEPVPLRLLADRLDQWANATDGGATDAYRHAAELLRRALAAVALPSAPAKPPEYVALYEPAGTLGSAITGGTPAVLARATETANGTPYYRPVMRGKLPDVALLVEQLAKVEQAGQLLPMEPDQPESQPERETLHFRVCGIAPHPHGVACSTDCPTCHGGERSE